MIVYFSASTRNIKDDIGTYRRIVKYIREEGHSISHDWVETAWLRSQKKLSEEAWDLQYIVLQAETGIDAAELVIVEANNSSTFGVGYEVALALQRRKPVLVLVKKEYAKLSYAAALAHDCLTVVEYDDKSLENVTKTFLRENTISTKDLRFNFVIDRKIYNYLRAKSFKSGKTKAELVRDLLLADIERED